MNPPFRLRMILSENRFPLFGIMRQAFVQADDNVAMLLFIPLFCWRMILSENRFPLFGIMR
jgi:hypothetical protein